MEQNIELLVIQTHKCEKAQLNQFTFTFTFTLPQTITFTEPYAVRLSSYLTLSTSKSQHLVFTDFTQSQIVNDKHLSFLGLTPSDVYNEYVQLANNTVPQVGQITIQLPPETNIRRPIEPKGIIVLHFVPVRVLNDGTKGPR